MTYELKYLFEAHFTDGSVVRQTPEDVSAVDPAKSAYFDVCQKGIENVAFFGLFDANNTYVVDLRDGHFEINGVPITFLNPPLAAGTPLKLVYYRQVRQHRNMTTGAESVEVEYHFGWEAELPGGAPIKNVIRIA